MAGEEVYPDATTSADHTYDAPPPSGGASASAKTGGNTQNAGDGAVQFDTGGAASSAAKSGGSSGGSGGGSGGGGGGGGGSGGGGGGTDVNASLSHEDQQDTNQSQRNTTDNRSVHGAKSYGATVLYDRSRGKSGATSGSASASAGLSTAAWIAIGATVIAAGGAAFYLLRRR